MTAIEIKEFLRQRFAWQTQLFVPEFTYRDLRIDAIVIDTGKRWIRGFEIKTSRADFLRDDKWHNYTQFCSSISIVCPYGLIKANEVHDPFGLLWVGKGKDQYGSELHWERRPKKFQQRSSLAWTWTYLKVIEMEFARLIHQNEFLKNEQARSSAVKPDPDLAEQVFG